ncbi:MAG: sensor histidine kinase [Acidimicrobiales bacterium]
MTSHQIRSELPARAAKSVDVDVVRQFAITATALLGRQSRHVHPRQVLNTLCERYVQSTGALGAVLMLVAPTDNVLEHVAGAGPMNDAPSIADLDINSSNDWFTQTFRSGQALFVDDTAGWEPKSAVTERALERGVTACWTTPLVTVEGDIIGTFSVGWPDAVEPGDDQLWLFQEFALLAQAVVDRQQSHWQRMALIAHERERIAGELHDDSVQAMTAVSLRLQRLQARLAEHELRQSVVELRHQVDEAIERLRHMLFSLSSPTLEQDGLVITLEIYLETYVEKAGLAWELHGDEALRLPHDVEALAFRLARGALINAIKHARATKVSVSVDRSDDGGLAVVIADDGIGFETGEITAKDKPGHVGLTYAQSLARAVGGSYAIDSMPGKGTTVSFSIPGF